MPRDKAEIEKELREAEAARAALEPMLKATAGWDDVDPAEVQKFVSATAPTQKAAGK